jgi:prepilin-type N-terminal cleavage/methylation domain-containing protein
MKRNTRKGFTGIELVIVIAIIAILAASLIPAFGGLFDGANKTADLQGAREMDAAIKMGALGQKIALPRVIEILDEAGFDITSLDPLYKGHKFYWSNEGQTIVLYDENAGKVAYPEGQLYAPADAEMLLSGACYFVTEVDTPAALKAALDAGTSIKLEADVALDQALTAKGDITIDLNGKKLETNFRDAISHNYAVNVEGNVTIVNGTINARGVQVMDGGKLTLGEGVTVNAIDSNGGAAVYVYAGGTLEISGGTYTTLNGVVDETFSDGPAAIINKGTTTITGGTFIAENSEGYLINNFGTLTITNGSFTANRGVLYNLAGTTTIEGGTFAVTDDVHGGWVVINHGTAVVVKDGTFDHVVDTRVFEGVTRQ